MMLNWFRGTHGEGSAFPGNLPVHIRIAFPSFGIRSSQPFTNSVADLSVSREEIAALLQRERN